MTVQELIDSTIRILKKGSGNQAKEKELILELEKLKSWVYPQLTMKNIVQVTRCKYCKHYKRYKQKQNPKAKPFYACEISRIKHDPDFFCSDGREL